MKTETNNLREAINLASMLKEDSLKADGRILDDCVNEAIEIWKVDPQLHLPIYLLLKFAWDDILPWAKAGKEED